LNVSGNTTLKATAIDGDLNMGNNKITSLAMPTNNSDAATKGYVDAAVTSVKNFWDECYTHCASNNNADCNSNYTRVYLFGAGTGCFSGNPPKRWWEDPGKVVNCWRTSSGTSPQYERCTINGDFYSSVECYGGFTGVNKDSSCAICCK